MSDESLHFKPRRGNANTMATNDTKKAMVLQVGELFLEYPSGGVGTGASKIKIGDGVTAYSALPYALGSDSSAADKLTTARTIALSGGATGTATAFDGSANITLPVTALDASLLTGTASVSTTGNAATATTTTGNAGTATALQTARSISLTGGVTGTATAFDGSADIAIPVTAVDASKITGTIDLEHIPQGALERCVVVADDTARFALTSTNVQTGDTVKVTATNTMYFVKDDTKLATADGYEVYTAGSATSVPWSGVTGKPDTYPPAEHTHLYAGSATAGGAATTALVCTGNSATATTLETARTIALSGGATGTATSFNGSADIVIPVTALDASLLTGTASVSTTGNAATATKLAAAVGITLTGDAAGTANFDGSTAISIATTVSHATSADAATKLATARNIAVTGAFTGTASFDGTADVSIALTSADFGDEG